MAVTAIAPRIGILGAGSVGCYLGARLLHAGAAVTLVGRARVLDELRANGLSFSDWRGERGQVPASALSVAQNAAVLADASLVLVTVKSADTEAAGGPLASVLAPQAVVLSLQNGVRNADLLRRALPGRTVLAGVVGFNVVPQGEGHFHQAVEGGLDVQRDAALSLWLPAFERAGLPLTLHDELAPVQWAKLLLNLNNPINALSDLPLKAQLEDRDFRRCLAAAQDEALALMREAHIRPARLTPLPPRWIPALLRLPNALFTRIARPMLAIDPSARTSMAQDLAQGRASEVDWINGEVLRLAESLGRCAPVNAALVALMHAAEAGGPRKFSGAALRARLEAGGQARAESPAKSQGGEGGR